MQQAKVSRNAEAIGTVESSLTPQHLSRFGIEVDEALRVGVPDFWESPMPEKPCRRTADRIRKLQIKIFLLTREDEGSVLDGISFGPWDLLWPSI